MTNRKNFPAEVKTLKLKHLESRYFRSESGVMLCAWKDKKASKPVIIVSTHSTKEEVEITNKRGITSMKPAVIEAYNRCMNGCDRMDQMASYYNVFNRKTIKWWKRMFMWCLEISQCNAFILFCLTRFDGEKPTSLLVFKKALISGILSAAKACKAEVEPNRFIRKPSGVFQSTAASHLVIWDKVDRNCVVCSTPGSRKRTKFKCNTCQIYLHPKECFVRFHTRK